MIKFVKCCTKCYTKKTVDEIIDALQYYIDNALETDPWQNANDDDKLAY